MVSVPPSEHLTDTAIVILRMIGAKGCRVTQLRESYPRLISEKRFPIPDLQLAEAFLAEYGFLNIENGFVARLIDPDEPTIRETFGNARVARASEPEAAMSELAGFIANEEERRDLVAWKFDAATDEANRALGAAGEEFVLSLVRDELAAAGDTTAVERCQRVSLKNDALGYDVIAPRAHSEMVRKFEVKTTRLPWDPTRVFVTRNEFTTGVRNAEEWSLVIVDASNPGDFRLLGHTSATALSHHSPSDRGSGRWQTMRVLLPHLALSKGLPQ